MRDRSSVRPGASALLLIACVLTYAALVVPSIFLMGTSYEEVVPYVVEPMDVASRWGPGPDPSVVWADHEGPGRLPGLRWVVSDSLPRLALQIGEHRVSVLNQVYMTNHLSFVGLVAGRLIGAPLYGARLLHALFGVLTILLVYDLGRSLLSPRAALLGAVLAATSFNVVFMFSWARFDESLPSVASLAVLAALLRFARDGRPRWLYAAALAAGIGVSGKITTLWPLTGMFLAALIATGPRGLIRNVAAFVRRATVGLRDLAIAAGLGLVWLVPMLAYAVTAPGAPTSGEARRRVAYLSDLLTTDVVPRTIENLTDYLGGWESLASEIARGKAVSPSWLGRAVVVATLGYLAWTAFRTREGAPPRRRRVETALLVVIGVVTILVAMFYREHQDYQFVLLVPLFSLGVAHGLDALAAAADRVLPVSAPRWAATMMVALPPVAGQLRDDARWWNDITHATNAMLDERAQRDSARYFEHADIRPITTTFYAVGQYELLTNGRVRPIHASNLFRADRRRLSPDELTAIWRRLLRDDCARPRYVLVALGSNPVEKRHFDEEGIRAALLADADAYPEGVSRVASFAGRAGEPLLELYRVGGCPRRPIPPPPSEVGFNEAAAVETPASATTFAALGGLTPGTPIGELVVSRVTEPVEGAILVHTEQGVTFEIRIASEHPLPPARTGIYAVYYRAPRGGGTPPAEALGRAAQAIAEHIAAGTGTMPAGLTPLLAP